jgi:hypothetical protein
LGRFLMSRRNTPPEPKAVKQTKSSPKQYV